MNWFYAKKLRKRSHLLALAIGLSAHPALVSGNALISIPEADVEAQVTQSQDPTVIREQAVYIASELIKPPESSQNIAADTGEPASSITLNLNFFGEPEPMVLVLDRSGKVGGNITSWAGHVQDNPDSQAVLVVGERGIVQGNITIGYKKYHIRYVEHVSGEPVHALQEIDVTKFPPDHDEEHADGIVIDPSPEPQSDQGNIQSDGLAIESDTDVVGSGAIIDVMVLYTAAAAAQVGDGSAAAMDAHIALAIAETNEGYEASNIAQRMNLIHSQQVAYTETGGSMADALYDLRNVSSAPNPITVVPGLRDTHKADLVGLLVSTAYSGCGLGYVGPSFGAGHQVTRQDCATGSYSFAHEFGHNQGAVHDRGATSGSSPDDGKYSYGYVKYDKSWRTIMGYSDSTRCAELPSPPYASGQRHCFRKNFWSNPRVSFEGDPTGIVSTDTEDGGADNGKWMNEKAYAVTNLQKNHATYALTHNQWYQIGLPYAPPSNQNRVLDILSDDITGEIGTDWAIFKYDSAAGYTALNTNSIMEQGVGYWIKQLTGSTVTLDMPNNFNETPMVTSNTKCPSSSGCFETPTLPTAAGTHKWSMLSNPYPQNKQLKGIVVDSSNASCQTNGCT